MKKIRVLSISLLLAFSTVTTSEAQAGSIGSVVKFVKTALSATPYTKTILSGHSLTLVDDSSAISKSLKLGKNIDASHDVKKRYEHALTATKVPGMNMCPESYKPNPLDDNFHQRPSENPC